MTGFGSRFAVIDLYNIWGTAYDIETLSEIVASLPGQQLADAVGGSGTPSMGLGLKLKTIASTFGHWSELYEIYQIRKIANRLADHYTVFPTKSESFHQWQRKRDAIMSDFYDVCGAQQKY